MLAVRRQGSKAVEEKKEVQ